MRMQCGRHWQASLEAGRRSRLFGHPDFRLALVIFLSASVRHPELCVVNVKLSILLVSCGVGRRAPCIARMSELQYVLQAVWLMWCGDTDKRKCAQVIRHLSIPTVRGSYHKRPPSPSPFVSILLNAKTTPVPSRTSRGGRPGIRSWQERPYYFIHDLLLHRGGGPEEVGETSKRESFRSART